MALLRDTDGVTRVGLKPGLPGPILQRERGGQEDQRHSPVAMLHALGRGGISKANGSSEAIYPMPSVFELLPEGLVKGRGREGTCPGPRDRSVASREPAQGLTAVHMDGLLGMLLIGPR
ncbi:hypothetical protein DPEC_G00104660 [Dallia pectoralis]|uniref:Uncharacterized protein n=1 Tax=Dallia pectoralis TaxID=75939 RepID=A0ACC2GXW1_DALPE|nr:hypothetical protein DPEC_G00104660 [Dallia pectoralis]